MLNAKLFAVMASIALLIAVLGRVRVLPYVGFRLVVGHFLLSSFHSQLLIAVISVNLAFGYYSLSRLTVDHRSQVIGLIGFLAMAMAFALRLTLDFILGRAALPSVWQMVLFSATVHGLYLGVFLSIADLTWLAWALSRQRV